MTLLSASLPLSVATEDGVSPVQVLYIADYDATARQLILDAKIGCCTDALDQLADALVKKVSTLTLDRDHDRIVAAPSSLWSRLHGRYDVAYELAFALAKSTSCPLRRAPLRQHWRLQKRAFLGKTMADNSRVYQPTRRGKILLVDDIVTTGWTMSRLAVPYLRRGFQVEGIAYALAGNYLMRGEE